MLDEKLHVLTISCNTLAGVQDCSDGRDEQNCGDCTFESDMCGYRDDSSGLYFWKRGQASFASQETYAPSYDHTSASESGGSC